MKEIIIIQMGYSDTIGDNHDIENHEQISIFFLHQQNNKNSNRAKPNGELIFLKKKILFLPQILDKLNFGGKTNKIFPQSYYLKKITSINFY